MEWQQYRPTPAHPNAQRLRLPDHFDVATLTGGATFQGQGLNIMRMSTSGIYGELVWVLQVNQCRPTVGAIFELIVDKSEDKYATGLKLRVGPGKK